MTAERFQMFLIALIIPLGVLYWYLDSNNLTFQELISPGTKVIHIGDATHRVEIANTEAERQKGLSGRKKLEGVDGMLFVFPEADYHGIWMKDMQFPIDIIWIGEDLRIINIEKNVAPNTYPRSFRPDAPAKYVIETNVHYSDTFDIRPGDKITLPLKYLDD